MKKRRRINYSVVIFFISLLAIFWSCKPVKNQWGKVEIGVDENGYYALLENEIIRVKYESFKPTTQDELPSSEIKEFIIKSCSANVASCDKKYVKGIDGAANRAELKNASIKLDSKEKKVIHLEYNGLLKDSVKRPDWDVDVSIYPDKPYIQIDYNSYWVNVVDQGCPGGTNNGVVKMYGGEEWKKLQGWDEFPLYQHSEGNIPLFNSTDNYGKTRFGDDPTPLSYKGYFIIGVFNPDNGIGYGRVMPVQAITTINVLSLATGPRGFEIFPYFGKEKLPYTQYLFAFTKGGDELIETGKKIVDEINLN